MIELAECFAKCSFSDKHLDSIRLLYAKYFDSKMPNDYLGYGVAAFWKETQYPSIADKEFDPTGGVRKISALEASDDPLWGIFSDLIPYMDSSAVITKMPSLNCMNPHIDRSWRPHAIYFPIEGCSPNCVSMYYENGREIGRYAVYENAYLTNVHKMHGVINKSNMTRIAFGWNFKSSEMTFSDCYDILTKLGYLNNAQ